MEPSKNQSNKENQLRWYHNNKTKVKEQKKSWYERNREHALAKNREWRLKKMEEEQRLNREKNKNTKPNLSLSYFQILDILRKDVKHYLWGKAIVNWNQTDWYNFNQIK